MVRFLIRWLVTSLAVFMVPSLISGVSVRNFGTALAASMILAVLNLLVKPILILLTLPLTVLTLGLFLLVINAILFQFAGFLVSGLVIESFWSALGASLIVSLVSWVASSWGDPRLPRVRHSRSARTIDMHRTDDGKWG